MVAGRKPGCEKEWLATTSFGIPESPKAQTRFVARVCGNINRRAPDHRPFLP